MRAISLPNSPEICRSRFKFFFISRILTKKYATFSHSAPAGVLSYMPGAKLRLLPLPFDEIMRRHERELMRYLLRVSGNREDALDLFQEIWLRAYGAYPRLQPESQVRPWLYAIALNLCRNRARDGARRARVIVANTKDRPADDQLGRLDRRSCGNDGYAAIRFRELVSALPERQREALRLRYFSGLAYGEIAEIMHCSEENARANVSQALKKFKSM
jgi:RNA polymerase sigma-70 factor (ECF subfamily)